MYYIIDKTTKEIMHKNPGRGLIPAPTPDKTVRRIWYAYDPVKHAAIDVGELPPNGWFDLIPPAAGSQFHTAEPWNLERRVLEKVETLAPDKKAVGDKLIDKTIDEMAADNTLELVYPVGNFKRVLVDAIASDAFELMQRGMVFNGKVFRAEKKTVEYLDQLIRNEGQDFEATWYTFDGIGRVTMSIADLIAFRDAMYTHVKTIIQSEHDRRNEILVHPGDVYELWAADFSVVIPASSPTPAPPDPEQ